MNIRVMTYNICSGHNMKHERRLDETAAFIREIGADIVGVNEVDYKNKRSSGVDQAAYLCDHGGYPYCIFCPSIDYQGGYYGNALLTKYPVLSRELLKIPYTAIPGNRRGEPRSILKCTLDVGGTPVTVMVSHYGLSVPEREEAVKLTMKLVDPEVPTLFMGDLNAVPEAEELAPLYTVLTDTAARFPDAVLNTIDSENPRSKIDFIFTTRHFTTTSIRVPAVQYSDHRPVLTELVLG